MGRGLRAQCPAGCPGGAGQESPGFPGIHSAGASPAASLPQTQIPLTLLLALCGFDTRVHAPGGVTRRVIGHLAGQGDPSVRRNQPVQPARAMIARWVTGPGQGRVGHRLRRTCVDGRPRRASWIWNEKYVREERGQPTCSGDTLKVWAGEALPSPPAPRVPAVYHRSGLEVRRRTGVRSRAFPSHVFTCCGASVLGLLAGEMGTPLPLLPWRRDAFGVDSEGGQCPGRGVEKGRGVGADSWGPREQ